MWLFSALQVGEETDHRCLPRHALQGPDRLGGWPWPETPWLLLLYFGAVRPIPVARGAPARPPQHCFQVRGWFASLLHCALLPSRSLLTCPTHSYCCHLGVPSPWWLRAQLLSFWRDPGLTIIIVPTKHFESGRWSWPKGTPRKWA